MAGFLAQHATGFDCAWGRILDQSKHATGPGKVGTGGSNCAFADGSARFARFGQAINPVNMWAIMPSLREAQ
jgi:prepilin-type processing-associated H-X9-DG protein